MVTDSFISDEEQSAAVVNPVSLKRDGTNWFIVQTYSGHEANVKQHNFKKTPFWTSLFWKSNLKNATHGNSPIFIII